MHLFKRDPSRKLTKQEFSWTMYDWANSAYATIIMAAIFPIYFTQVTGGAGTPGDIAWGYGTSVATLIMVILAPVFGSIADFRGMKKRLFAVCVLVGAGFTLMMAIADHWQWMLVGYIISYLGFALGNLFYDSFLTDVTTPDRMDMVSAKGYAMGYIGGSTIPFLLAICLMLFAPSLHIDGDTAVKACVVMTSLWWAVFSLPLFRNVKQVHYIERPEGGIIRASLGNLLHTAREIRRVKPLLLFMIAYFFYIDGVGTVIHMSTSYGTKLGLNSTGMVLALMLTQLVAVPCSLLFARLAKKCGSRRTLLFGICVYIVVCILGFWMGNMLEQAELQAQAARQSGGEAAYLAVFEPTRLTAQKLFWVLAFLVGTSQGGMQALSRSQFGRMIPPARSNEFFGFFDIFGKFATVLGPFLFAFTADLTGRSSVGILSLLLLFFVGICALMLTPREAFEQDYHQLFGLPPERTDAA